MAPRAASHTTPWDTALRERADAREKTRLSNALKLLHSK
jgi:hypothetical protein